MHDGWYGVDLDRTLAFYNTWEGITHIGPFLEPMVETVKKLLADGNEVRIFTARVSKKNNNKTDEEIEQFREELRKRTKETFGVALEATAEKDFGMIGLYDDRCVQIVPNVGIEAMLAPLETYEPFTRLLHLMVSTKFALQGKEPLFDFLPVGKLVAQYMNDANGIDIEVKRLHKQYMQLRQTLIEIGRMTGCHLEDDVSSEYLLYVKEQVRARMAHVESVNRELRTENSELNATKPYKGEQG